MLSVCLCAASAGHHIAEYQYKRLGRVWGRGRRLQACLLGWHAQDMQLHAVLLRKILSAHLGQLCQAGHHS